MFYDVIDYNNQVVGQIEAPDPIEARIRARGFYGVEILDVREAGKPSRRRKLTPEQKEIIDAIRKEEPIIDFYEDGTALVSLGHCLELQIIPDGPIMSANIVYRGRL